MAPGARRLAIASIVLLAACAPPQSAPSQAIPRGGTLRVAVVDPDWPRSSPNPNACLLDPNAQCPAAKAPETVTAGELFQCCLARSLLSYSGQPTDKGGADLRPDLATAMPEVSTDGLTWTFHLRAGIYYAPPLPHTEIVAADFIRPLERLARLLKGARGSPLSVLRGFDDFAAGTTSSIGGLEASNPHTLVIHLTHPQGDLGYWLASFGIVPIPALPADPAAPFGVATGHDDAYGAFFVSSGPYMIEGSDKLTFSLPPAQQQPVSGLVPDRSLTLVRNPSWIAATDPLRPADADRIVLSYGRSDADAVAQQDRGAVDLVLSWAQQNQPLTDQIAAYQSNPHRGRVDVEPEDAVRYVSMNLAVPPFDDLHVRRAIAYAIDRAAIVKELGGSVHASMTGHIALDSMEDNALLSFDRYRTQDAAARVATARAEMALSPYDPDHDGLCDVAACRNVLALARAGPGGPPTAIYDQIRQDLGTVGITIDVRPLSVNDFFDQIGDPRSHTRLGMGWIFGKDYPNGSDYFVSSFDSIAIERGANYSLVGATPDQLKSWGYAVRTVPNVDDRITRCWSLVGNAQTRCWTALDQYMMEQVLPVIPLSSLNRARVIPSRIVAYSYDQSWTVPALDRIAVKH